MIGFIGPVKFSTAAKVGHPTRAHKTSSNDRASVLAIEPKQRNHLIDALVE